MSREFILSVQEENDQGENMHIELDRELFED